LENGGGGEEDLFFIIILEEGKKGRGERKQGLNSDLLEKGDAQRE